MNLYAERPSALLREFVILPALIQCISLSCQFTAYERTFGGSGYEGGQALITSDGGVLVFGGTESYGPNAAEYYSNGYVMKLDPTGETIWKTVLGNDDSEGFSDAIELVDGGFLLVGGTLVQLVQGSNDMIMVRIDAEGTLIWTKRLRSDGTNEGARLVLPAGDDNFIIIGNRSDPQGSLNGQVIVYKIDLTGEVLWSDRIDGGGMTQAADAGMAEDGSFRIDATRIFQTSNDHAMLSISGDGELLWGMVYDRIDGHSAGAGIAVLPDGSALFTGQTSGSFLIGQVDPQGALLWDGSYSCGYQASGIGIHVSEDGDMVVCANIYFPGYTQWSQGLFLFGSMGALLDHVVMDTVYRSATSLEGDGSGRFVLGGSINTEAHPEDIDIVQFMLTGDSIPEPCDAIQAPVTPDDPFSVQVFSPFVQLAEAMPVVEDLLWEQVTEGQSSLICSDVALPERTDAAIMKCYPNPAHDMLYFDVTGGLGIARVEVFDVTGKSLMRATRPSAPRLPVAQLVPGTYCCRVHLDDGRTFAVPFMVE